MNPDLARIRERRIRREAIRRNRMRVRMGIGIVCILAIFAFAKVVSSRASVVDATGTSSQLKYKVVEIESGDSLWSIARENYSSRFGDVYTYVATIRKCNHIKGSRILPGYKLTIPYYD